MQAEAYNVKHHNEQLLYLTFQKLEGL